MNQPVKAGQRRAQASTIAQIKVTTAVMGAMVARRQQRLKMPRPDAYTVPFIALGGLGWGWWPFNIMATLLVATLCAWLIEVGGPTRLVAAAAAFIVGSALVEFWWPGLAVCLLAWAYCRRPCWLSLALWIGALASLYVINRDLCALAALPLIFAAGRVKVTVPRGRLGFYVYYPAHLAVLWIVAQLL